jgi:hypothetical protein
MNKSRLLEILTDTVCIAVRDEKWDLEKLESHSFIYKELAKDIAPWICKVYQMEKLDDKDFDEVNEQIKGQLTRRYVPYYYT